MFDTSSTTIRDIVAEDFRAAAVFERHHIDFCCGGDRPIAEACQEKGIDATALVADLEAATQAAAEVPRFKEWDLDVLASYIVSNHHAYVRRAIDTVGAHTRKVATVHGERHPETVKVAELFEAVAADMAQHMVKEERVLFPYIARLAEAARDGAPRPVAPFGTIQNPIRMMEVEHQSAGDLVASLREVTGGFVPPADGCTTYKVTYRELEEFETDLHRHVHLENNILFPKAIELERALHSGR